MALSQFIALGFSILHMLIDFNSNDVTVLTASTVFDIEVATLPRSRCKFCNSEDLPATNSTFSRQRAFNMFKILLSTKPGGSEERRGNNHVT